MVIVRLAWGADDSVYDAVLSPGLGSVEVVLTVAVLTAPLPLPSPGVSALTVTVASAPEARLPSAQVTVPAAKVQLPCELVEDT